jgi:chemotaxis protein MotB
MLGKKDNNTNFWISYADLMAGLLFVFILLIGAIIVKYSLLQDESKILEKTLKEEKVALEQHKQELIKKEEKLKNILLELEKTQNKLEVSKDNLKQSMLENEKLKLLLKEQKDFVQTQKEQLLQKNEKLRLAALLKEEYDKKIQGLEKDKLTLEAAVDSLKLSTKVKEEKLNSLLEEIVVKQNAIDEFKKKSLELNDEIKVMAVKLNSIKKEHELLVKDLQSTKQKIKNLTGIKIKVITLLKEKLGKNIKIDPKSGNLRLSSNVLFDEGKSELKPNAKAFLKNAVYDYFQTITENKEINKYIDTIVIEGHTNSKGTFLYNLDLSQKRAYSVMDFLLSLDFKNKDELRNLVVASGRSYLDPIFDKNGKEDSEASRRIEIKLNIKNEEAMKEIESILK